MFSNKWSTIFSIRYKNTSILTCKLAITNKISIPTSAALYLQELQNGWKKQTRWHFLFTIRSIYKMRYDHKLTRICHDPISTLRRAPNKVRAIILLFPMRWDMLLMSPLLKWRSQIIEVMGPLLQKAVLYLYKIIPHTPPHPLFSLDSCGSETGWE